MRQWKCSVRPDSYTGRSGLLCQLIVTGPEIIFKIWPGIYRYPAQLRLVKLDQNLTVDEKGVLFIDGPIDASITDLFWSFHCSNTFVYPSSLRIIRLQTASTAMSPKGLFVP